MKSEKNVVRDILIAQGLPWNTKVCNDAIDVLHQYGFSRWQEGYNSGLEDSDWEIY